MCVCVSSFCQINYRHYWIFEQYLYLLNRFKFQIQSRKSPPSTVPSPLSTPQKEPNKVNKSPTTPPVRTRRTSVLQSPPKANPRRTSTPVSSNSNDTNEMQVCFVCQVSGTVQDLVK